MPRRDVFVSYSKPDIDATVEVVAYLEEHGIPCWYAGRDVPAGADWPGEIVQAIAQARIMVLMFSASANQSAQVRREVQLATEANVRVVPVRILDLAPSSGLAYWLSGQQWVDAFPAPLAPHCARLLAQLDSLLAPDTSAATPLQHAASAPPVAGPAVSAHTLQFAGRPWLEATHLRRLEQELAYYIGPIARWTVERAAASANSTEMLVHELSTEIASATERQRFIKACSQWLSAG